jgi:hypothetical protein
MVRIRHESYHGTESLTQKACNCLLQQNRHKADIAIVLNDVCFRV